MYWLVGLFTFFGLLPFILIFFKVSLKALLVVVLLLNFIAWALVVLFSLRSSKLKAYIKLLAEDLRFSTKDCQDFEKDSRLLFEIRKRSQLLSSDLIEKSLSSVEDLSDSLDRILKAAIRLINLESAELALRDSESGLFHSSFIIGKAFKSEMRLPDNNEPLVEGNVVTEPINFSGTLLGGLRVAFKYAPVRPSDLYLLKILAMQSAISILNAHYTEELIKMKVTSEDSVKAKTGFLANLSHELRGPLGTIINAAELVVEGLYGPISEEQKDTLSMVKKNGTHLLDLINDVLDYAKIEAGKITPRTEVLNANETLNDVANVIRSQAVAKGHKLQLREGSDDWYFYCDRRHSRQILINLLTNAIKYTPPQGQIEFSVEPLSQSRLKFIVKDNGIGMPRDQHYKVFSAFERIDNEYTKNQTGTGIGMPLTKKMVEVNEGFISFESEEGKGSTFWVILPLADKQEAIDAEANKEDISEAVGRGEVVCIVSKQPEERKLLQDYLSHRGFQVIVIEDLANDKASMKPQVAIVGDDLLEQYKRPAELVAKIRKSCRSADFPIIAISARAFSFDVEEYLREGIDRVLTKPIEFKEVGIVVRSLIDRK